jgi:glycosyltransferase involved in cell wall biosynthesis
MFKPSDTMFLKATHFATFAHTLGGLQAVVRYHLRHDCAWRITSSAQIFFEDPVATATSSETALGLNRWTTIAQARQSLAARHLPQPDQTVIYHDLWGLPFFADMDGAGRRLGIIHCPDRQVLDNLANNHDLLDGILCVGQPTAEAALRCWPSAGRERIGFAPVPVDMPESPIPHPMLAGRPFVVGYSGRLIRPNKRVDRLREFHRQLRQTGLNFRLELLGEGPEEARLRHQFKNCPEARFHGRRTGDDYWRILNQWDAIIYLSDVEGMGISMLEAMSVGVLPLHPLIGGGGEAYLKSINPDFLYPAGDLAAAARIVRSLSTMPDTIVQSLRAKCREAVLPHKGDNYMDSFRSFLARIQTLPRVSRAAFKPRPFYFCDHIPFGILNHTFPRAFVSNGHA